MRPGTLRMRFWRLAVAGGIVALVLVIPSGLEAHAAQSTLALSLSSPYTPAIGTGMWVPLVATITNSGANFRGTLVIVTQAGSPARCVGPAAACVPPGPVASSAAETDDRIPVNLAAGTRKQFVVDAVMGQDGAHGSLLDSSGNAVVTASDSAATYSGRAPDAVAVISDDPSALDSAGSIRLPDGSQPQVIHLMSADLPSSDAPLNGLFAVIFDGATTAGLSTAQRRALVAYAARGGTVLTVAGPRWRDTVAGLPTALVPAGAGAAQPVATLTTLQTMLGVAAPTRPLDVAALSPAPGAAVVLADSGLPIEVSARVGAGRAVVLAVDPSSAAAEAWPGGAAMLRSVLAAAWSASAGSVPDAMASVGAAAPVVQLVPVAEPLSTGLLGIFIVLYVLFTGPLVFFVLWRRRRIDRTWVVVPAIAVATTAVVLALGLTGSSGAVVNVARTVVAEPASGIASVETYAGVFLQHGGSHTITLSGASATGAMPQLEANSGAVSIERDASGDTIVAVDGAAPSELRGAVSESDVAGVAPIHIVATRNGTVLSGSLTNRTGTPLIDVQIVFPGTPAQPIGGDLAPQQSVPFSVTVPATTTGVPCAGACTVVNPTTLGSSPRQRAASLADSVASALTQRRRTSNTAYVVAASEQPLAGLPALDGGGAPVYEVDSVIEPIDAGAGAGSVGTLVDIEQPTPTGATGQLILAPGGRAVFALPVGHGASGSASVQFAATGPTPLKPVPCAVGVGCVQPTCPPTSSCVFCATGAPATCMQAAQVEVFDAQQQRWQPLSAAAGANGQASFAVPSVGSLLMPDGSLVVRVDAPNGAFLQQPPSITLTGGAGA